MASQVPAHRPVGSSMPVAATQVCLVASQVVQVPVQSALVQQPAVGMQTVVPPVVHDLVEPVQL